MSSGLPYFRTLNNVSWFGICDCQFERIDADLDCRSLPLRHIFTLRVKWPGYSDPTFGRSNSVNHPWHGPRPQTEVGAVKSRVKGRSYERRRGKTGRDVNQPCLKPLLDCEAGQIRPALRQL